MQRFVRLSTTSTAFLVLSGALAACAAQVSQTAVAPQAAAVDSVAAKLVELELQRISAATTVDSVSIREVDGRIQGLRQRLQSLRPDGSGRQLAVDRVLSALDARQASVASNLSAARMVYTDQYPSVRRLIEETRLIEERRREIKAGRL